MNEATRQKVLQAVQQTGYRPNVLAKSLKSGRSNTICLMVPSMQNPIFPEMARGVEDVARRSGFTVVLCNTNEDDTVEKAYIDKMKTQWIDGFVVCSSMGRADHIRALRGEGFPLVLVNRFEEIFAETVKLNTLDYKLYQTIQQKIIDVLDTADQVHITGKGKNKTDLYVNIWKLKDPAKETAFENCVADVNIPVGEVFTSPVLEKTTGILSSDRST